jgi:hypothetical protein
VLKKIKYSGIGKILWRNFVITMQWPNGNPKCNIDGEPTPTLISSPIGEA